MKLEAHGIYHREDAQRCAMKLPDVLDSNTKQETLSKEPESMLTGGNVLDLPSFERKLQNS